MKLSVFSARKFDQEFLGPLFKSKFPDDEIIYHNFSLSEETASLAQDSQAVCVFVNDKLDSAVLHVLHGYGVRAILLRCAGFNNVDLETAHRLGMFVANVPAYSPEAVAEFAVALIQTLNRNTHRAYNRVREGNFSLEGFLGRTLHGKTVGIVGVGKIGLAFAKIMNGFGCHILAYDPYASKDFEKYGKLVSLDELLEKSHIVSLHCPLTPQTKHIINSETLAKFRKGALLVNTSRGELIDTTAAINALKKKQLDGLAIDVYEAESGLFYNDHSLELIEDDELMRLMTFPNVLVCGHQAFFTHEALTEIAEATISNLADFTNNRPCKNDLLQKMEKAPGPALEPVRI
jgi:D-lactate dehydrogenase